MSEIQWIISTGAEIGI